METTTIKREFDSFISLMKEVTNMIIEHKILSSWVIYVHLLEKGLTKRDYEIIISILENSKVIRKHNNNLIWIG